MIKQFCMALAMAMSAAGPVSAQNRPSFDCAKAKGDVENAICKSAELSSLDREIALTFGQLRRRLGPEAARALRQEQETFNATRDVAMANPDSDLKSFMAEHLTWLRRIQLPAADAGSAAFIGEWSTPYGTVSIKPGKSGVLAIEINTTSGVSARWVCEVSGEARLRDGKLTFKEDNITIILARKGDVLGIEEIVPASQGRDYCGANGAIEGQYFKLRPGE